LANLDEHYGLAIESITVDRAAKPGVVNASVSFAQAKP
jgi:type II secretory pathway component PulM